MKEHGYNVLQLTTILSEMTSQLYRHFDEGSNLLYVGISLNTFARLSQHKQHAKWFEKIKSVKIEHFETREQAIAAEKWAIKQENPKFNIALKKTMAEIEQEKKDLMVETSRIMQEKMMVLTRRVDYRVAYTQGEVKQMLNMTQTELDRHMDENKLSFFTVEGRPSRGRPPKLHRMVSGWSLIDFIDYLERKNK